MHGLASSNAAPGYDLYSSTTAQWYDCKEYLWYLKWDATETTQILGRLRLQQPADFSSSQSQNISCSKFNLIAYLTQLTSLC